MAERLLKSDADGVRGWFNVLSRFNTIRSRLYLAFGLAAGMTVVGSLFALYASANISATMTEIVSRSMPATVESLRLAEEASTLVASAPRLMTASDDNRRDEIARDIAAQSQMLSDRIARLRQLDAGQTEQIEVARAAMVERLDALNQAVTERLKISAQRRALALSVRKVHEDILEAITPAIDDANFDLMTRNQAAGGNAAVNQSIEALRRLLEIQSGINLLSGLLIESSMVTDVANLAPMRDPIASAQRGIEGNLKALPQTEQTKKIAVLYQKLATVAGSNGIVTQRTNELNREQDARQVYAAATAEAARLRKAVEGSIERQGKFAQTLSGRAISQIRVGRILLIILSIAALAAAGLIAWLYVGRSIVGRLTLLSGAMRRIADGESDVPVPVGGRDEIAGMAKALLVFRQAIAEVSVARQREADRAEDSEQRRQRVEAATQNFERAVNEVIQALDGASKSMDGCAHIMADAADHNKTRAAAAATASEEATTNVSNVAMAAEEIAQSVEQISTQAARSAHIAAPGLRRNQGDHRHGGTAGRLGGPDQQCQQSDPRRRRADQSPGAQRHHRGGARRRRRPRFCRRGARGQEPRRADREGDRRHHPANLVDRSDDVAGGSGHEGDRRHDRAARRKCQRHFGRGAAAGRGQQGNRP